jgi:transcriptional regulator with XRE-family HTH domain
MTVPKKFGEKLRTLRTSRKLTLSELSSSLGYSTHSYLSEVEAGRKGPTVALVLKVADFFTVSTDSLLRDEIRLNMKLDDEARDEQQ